MREWDDTVRASISAGAIEGSRSSRTLVARYGDLRGEYDALADGIALIDRSYRCVLEISGADRAPWLHNLTTNQVKPLQPGDGNYAFSANIKGRILFDLNILVGEESIVVDLDRRFVDTAIAHFNKYKVIEDVTIRDRREDFVIIALAGAGAPGLLAALGATHASTMPVLGHTPVSVLDSPMKMVRHDFCGSFAIELHVPADVAGDVWRALAGRGDEHRAMPVGADAVEIRRIEAGLPWPGSEITDDVLPAETGQFERAVSFNKGCYLGQEIVERMRSRGSVAKRLVGLHIQGDSVPTGETRLELSSGHVVGAVTSACHSPAGNGVVALGYVKSASAEVGTELKAVWDQASAGALVVGFPICVGETS